MYANAVVDAHEDFDIVEFAEGFFDTGKQLLIVKEKGRKVHWHVHGTWIGDRKAYKEIPHPARKGDGQRKTRPVRVAFDKDEVGFKYCCKEYPPNVVKKWHISEEQIAKWHDEWAEGKVDIKMNLKRAMRTVDIQADEQYGGSGFITPEVYFRRLKKACYDWLIGEDKLLCPPCQKQYILTFMYETDSEQYKAFVLDQ